MKKTVLRCTAMLSVFAMTALGEPSSLQTINDSDLLAEIQESNYCKDADVIASQTLNMSSLYDNNYILNPQFPQQKNLNKNSEKLNCNFGHISTEEFELLVQLVAAEAENQPFEGKRAVAAVVLNRVEFGWPFEDTIEGVIFQENQFSCISDGRFFKADSYISEEDMDAVLAELTERSDTEIIFFRTERFSDYGTPAYQIGDHFFSTK